MVNDTTITVSTPAGAEGPSDVVVIDPAGNGSLPAGFTFIPADAPSSIQSISPASGLTIGGTTVTITGTGFTGATGVTFGGAAGTDFSVVDDTTITVRTPASTAGSADVTILDPAGDGTTPAGFTYVTSAGLAVTGTTSAMTLVVASGLLLLGLASRRLSRIPA